MNPRLNPAKTNTHKPNPAAAALRFLAALEEYQKATVRIAQASAQMQKTTCDVLTTGISLVGAQERYRI